MTEWTGLRTDSGKDEECSRKALRVPNIPNVSMEKGKVPARQRWPGTSGAILLLSMIICIKKISLTSYTKVFPSACGIFSHGTGNKVSHPVYIARRGNSSEDIRAYGR